MDKIYSVNMSGEGTINEIIISMENMIKNFKSGYIYETNEDETLCMEIYEN